MITDVTERLIQKTIDEGGKVYAFSGSQKVEIVSASNNQIVLDLDAHVFQVGETLRFLYEPLFKSPYCDMVDTDGDGIIDKYDLDADGDGVWDVRKPDLPSHIVLKVVHEALAPDQVILDISPIAVDTLRARLWGVPIIVDRYYPIYITEEEALLGSPLAIPSAHEHFLDNRKYWMPEGVDLWHGNYHTCKPLPPDQLSISAVETYDFEYVDRVHGETGFNSIIPRDYVNKILAIDTDENGTFDSQVNYYLSEIYNIGEDYNHNHYRTVPEQAWLYEVIAVETSEIALPEGHSFKLGNFVYNVRLTTKFDIGTADNDSHTSSVFKFLSELTNGSNADINTTNGGGIIKYVDDTDTWKAVSALELNENNYVVLDERLFEIGDQFYIHAELPPLPVSYVLTDILQRGNEPSHVVAVGSDIRKPSDVNVEVVQLPLEVSNVIAGFVLPPSAFPTLVTAGILSSAPDQVVAVASVRVPSHIYVVTEISDDPDQVIAQEIFDPSTLNLLHWYDASDPNAQTP